MYKIVDFTVPAEHRVKLRENDKKDKYLDLARELKKTVEHKSDAYTNWYWRFWYSHQRTGKRTWGLGNKGTSGDHQNYYIIEISQNAEKSLAVTPVKGHQLTLMWKTLKK